MSAHQAMSAHQEFEAVIGLEVHCQLATDTKIFCGCRARVGDGKSVADAEVNSNTCPVCTGQPGSLPVLNRKVVEYAIRAGLATESHIRLKNVFARKNYFYPDLPKGYQISQYDKPICEKGRLQIETSKGTKTIEIQRIHMEEDAGKNLHLSGFSLVNLNRACVPLIEIVSGPDMRSAEEAGAYLRALYAIVTAIGICDGNLQEGNFRCDANVSIRPKGSEQFGTRAEIKNVNSFRFVEKAIEYEIRRQAEVIRSGGKVIQETRQYDSDKDVTFSLRSKEEAQDYRYFPEPDLIPVTIDENWIEDIRVTMPELPQAKKQRFISALGLTPYDAGVLTSSPTLAQFFEETVKLGAAAKSAANYLTGEVARLLNEEAIDISASRLEPQHIADVVALTQSQALSSTGAKQVIALAWKSGEAVATIVDREGLKQVNDTSALEPIIAKVLEQNAAQAAELKAGKDKLMGFFVGQVMKASGGKANPALLQELIRKKLMG